MSAPGQNQGLYNTSEYFIVFSSLLLIVLALACVYYGTIHIDEGYYHLMGRLVLDGKLPYLDFFAVQGPVYPYYLAPWIFFFGSTIVLARFSSMILLLITFYLTVRLSWKYGGKPAAAVTAGLLSFNLFLIYYYSIIKLYALTGFLIIAGFSFFHARGQSLLKLCLALICLALAAATRLSVVPGFIFMLIYVLFFSKEKWMHRVCAVLMSLLLLGTVMLPFYTAAPEQFRYGLFTYHRVKDSNFSLAQNLVYKIDSLINLVRSFFLLLLMIVSSLVFRFFVPDVKQGRDLIPGWGAGWIFILLTTLVHFSAASPRLNNYSVIIVPLAAFYISVFLTAILSGRFDRAMMRWTGAVFICGCVLTLFIQGKESFSLVNGRSAVSKVTALSHYIREHTPEGQYLVSYNNSIAVMAGRDVLPGFEMNTLSYAEDWDRGQFEKYRVLNTDILLRDIRQGRIGAFIITGHTFIGNFPVFYNPGEKGVRDIVMKEIKKYYRKARTLPELGYFDTPVEVYLPRAGGS